jgi:hypothetical protein
MADARPSRAPEKRNDLSHLCDLVEHGLISPERSHSFAEQIKVSIVAPEDSHPFIKKMGPACVLEHSYSSGETCALNTIDWSKIILSPGNLIYIFWKENVRCSWGGGGAGMMKGNMLQSLMSVRKLLPADKIPLPSFMKDRLPERWEMLFVCEGC